MSLKLNSINYEDFKDICRMCMLNCDLKFCLDYIVSNIFHKLTNLHLETNDDLPKQICLKCFNKINEINEFMFQCIRTHNALMECLKQEQLIEAEVPNEEQDAPENTDITKKFEIMKFNKNIELDEGIIPEAIEIKEEVIENTDLQETNYNYLTEGITINELEIEIVKDEHVIDEASEIYNDQSIKCSEDNLLISNTSNINIENNKMPKFNDLNKDTNSSDCSNTLDLSSGMNKYEDKVYKCDVCYKTFIYFKVFKQHMNLPDCKRPFKCDQCSKSFKKSRALKTHMGTHTGERPVKCDQCLKSYMRLNDLKIHMRTHTGERQFKCDQCSKSFNRASILKDHMSTHSGERQFKCDRCSKSFGRSSTLKDHMRTHSGERLHKCNLCSKSFRHSFDLHRHLRTHSGERPFECDQCSKAFTLSSALCRHKRVHTGERQFKCDQCSKSYSRLDHMKRHMLTHTG